MSDVMVINFGCPRTGTTYMDHLIKHGCGYIQRKIGEGHACHPIQSTKGLLGLVELFSDYKGKGNRRLVFIRTVRHPAEILSSWAAMPVPGNASPKKQQKPLRQRVTHIRREYASTKMQISRMAAEKPWKLMRWSFVDVRYEDIGGKPVDTAKLIADNIGINPDVNSSRFAAFIDDTWGKKPVRTGRLSEGGQTKPEPHLFSAACEHLHDVMKAHGYDD